ncbi:MAG: hypothetical protein OEX22_04580 [Cyclobacteriaceae bacterium]|nr:hypothetical protein [Cyclobacteriaceae bacterium]
MKISNILIAFIILFSVSCITKNEHGHDHGTESHDHHNEEDSMDHHHEQNKQEEFTIEEDSIQIENDSTYHTHEDGSKHHDH